MTAAASGAAALALTANAAVEVPTAGVSLNSAVSMT
jgi:hypothetical protein